MSSREIIELADHSTRTPPSVLSPHSTGRGGGAAALTSLISQTPDLGSKPVTFSRWSYEFPRARARRTPVAMARRGLTTRDNVGGRGRPSPAGNGREPAASRAHECITCDDRLTAARPDYWCSLRILSANSAGRRLTAFPARGASAKRNRHRRRLRFFPASRPAILKRRRDRRWDRGADRRVRDSLLPLRV